jgi:2,3-bisphosphoglycerate-dependent phosphoglycerate mutase
MIRRVSDLRCPVRLLCVRHAAAEGSPRLAGDDRPLSAQGRREADALADRLAVERVAVVHTSPLLRAQQTADLLGQALGTPVKSDDRLREFTAGSLDVSQLPVDAAHVTAVFGAWLDGELARRAGDGETGEAVVDRFRDALEDISDLHRGETVLLISHGGVLTLVLTVLSPNLHPAWVRSHTLGTTALVEMSYDDGGWVCTSWAGHVPR